MARDPEKDPQRTPRVVVRKDGSVAETYGAARGYSRARFKPGNLAGLKHGAHSERIVSAIAEVVAMELLEIVHSSRGERTTDKGAVEGSEG